MDNATVELPHGLPTSLLIGDGDANHSVCNFDFDDKLKNITSLVGSFIATTGIILNIFILVIFRRISRTTGENRAVFFLQALSFYDIGVLVCYMFLYPLKVLSEFILFIDGYTLWVHLVEYLFPMSRFFQMATTYVTLVTTIYNSVSMIKPEESLQLFTKIHCCQYILVVSLFSFLCHVSRHWEVQKTINEACNESEFGRYTLERGPLLYNPQYTQIYSLYFTNIVTLILPFTVLLALTALNVAFYLHRPSEDTRHRALNGNLEVKYNRHRDATMVMIVLVVAHLMFNVLAMIVSLLEVFAAQFIKENQTFHTASVEIINILAITNSSSRIANYLVFNNHFRREAVSICQCVAFGDYYMVPTNTTSLEKSPPAQDNGLLMANWVAKQPAEGEKDDSSVFL